MVESGKVIYRSRECTKKQKIYALLYFLSLTLMAIALIHPSMHPDAPFFLDLLLYSIAIMFIFLVFLDRSHLMNRHFIIYENGISNTQRHILPITDCNNPQEMRKPKFVAWEDIEYYSYQWVIFNSAFYIIYKKEINGEIYHCFSNIKDDQVKVLMGIMQQNGITEIFPGEWYYNKRLHKIIRKSWLKKRKEMDALLNSELKKFKYGKVCSMNQWAYDISIYRTSRKEGRKLVIVVNDEVFLRNCLFSFKLVKALENEFYQHFGKEHIKLLSKEKYAKGLMYISANENTKNGLILLIKADLEFIPYWGMVALHPINENNRDEAMMFAKKINHLIPDYPTQLQNVDGLIREARPSSGFNMVDLR